MMRRVKDKYGLPSYDKEGNVIMEEVSSKQRTIELLERAVKVIKNGL